MRGAMRRHNEQGICANINDNKSHLKKSIPELLKNVSSGRAGNLIRLTDSDGINLSDRLKVASNCRTEPNQYVLNMPDTRLSKKPPDGIKHNDLVLAVRHMTTVG